MNNLKILLLLITASLTSNIAVAGASDYSDAGMAYYLCADLDGVRGDEFGNPEKLERWIGSEPIAIE
ncbi:MAG: hypothetical protein R3Y44_07385 [Rikenellaceae bacterium]